MGVKQYLSSRVRVIPGSICRTVCTCRCLSKFMLEFCFQAKRGAIWLFKFITSSLRVVVSVAGSRSYTVGFSLITVSSIVLVSTWRLRGLPFLLHIKR